MNGDEQLLNGRVYGADHDVPNPGPRPNRIYAELGGSPLDGLLLDIHGWRTEEVDDSVDRLAPGGGIDPGLVLLVGLGSVDGADPRRLGRVAPWPIAPRTIPRSLVSKGAFTVIGACSGPRAGGCSPAPNSGTCATLTSVRTRYGLARCHHRPEARRRKTEREARRPNRRRPRAAGCSG
jgi:hypothetical protein